MFRPVDLQCHSHLVFSCFHSKVCCTLEVYPESSLWEFRLGVLLWCFSHLLTLGWLYLTSMPFTSCSLSFPISLTASLSSSCRPPAVYWPETAWFSLPKMINAEIRFPPDSEGLTAVTLLFSRQTCVWEDLLSAESFLLVIEMFFGKNNMVLLTLRSWLEPTNPHFPTELMSYIANQS